jgi:hypothetical protein
LYILGFKKNTKCKVNQKCDTKCGKVGKLNEMRQGIV